MTALRTVRYVASLVVQWFAYASATRRLSLLGLLVLGPPVVIVYAVTQLVSPLLLYPFV